MSTTLQQPRAGLRFWTQLLQTFHSIETWIQTRLLRRQSRAVAVAEPPKRPTLSASVGIPGTSDSFMDAPPEPAARSAAAVQPLGRFLRSKLGKRYIIATSRATGGFGKYRFAVDDQGEAWALREMVNATNHEVTALRTLGQRFTVRDEVDHGDRYLLVLPLMAGELPDAVSRLREPSIRRALGRSVVAQFAGDLAFIHSQGYVHRDVKLAAGLWHDDGSIVIAEFGSARQKDEKQRAVGACGTSGYMAPEMLFHESYDEKVDVWSLAMAFTAIHDNRLQRLFALAPRNPDILVSFSQWRKELLARPNWVSTLRPGRERWDEYFANLAGLDEEMCQLVLEHMLEPVASKRAHAAEVQRLARRLHSEGVLAERELLRALETLASADAKRDASLTTLRAQI